MVGTATPRRGSQQGLSVANGGQDLCPDSAPPSNAGSECGGIEFSREDVDALLSEKIKAKNKFNYKERCENMVEYIKRLRLCLRWFQEVEASYMNEHERLTISLEIAERRLAEIEFSSRIKEEELSSIVAELSENLSSIQEKLLREQEDKKVALDSLVKEREGRLSSEKSEASLSQELSKAQLELSSANERMSSINDMYKRLQEYNSSLQQYNCKLQSDLNTTSESLQSLEKEKATLVENFSHLRGQHSSLQEQFSTIKVSYEDASKKKDLLDNEVQCLRGDLQHVREERDKNREQVEALTTEVVKYKEYTGRSIAELDNLTLKSKDLEVRCLSQCEQIRTLQDKLTIAETRVEEYSISSVETQAACEEQRKLINDLQTRLTNAESKVIEGEKLRKKLHNTILELKGNIRVFCRVRPLLPGENSSEDKSISYPTSMEFLGRGVELVQNGQKHSFTFDKVFMPEASQDDVFVEISQLVQSALDGYKVCVFAYGQTGSGKTYTMMGKPGIPEEQGLIPRCLEQIFQTKQSHQSQGWRYEMQVSMLEIYNEMIRDLLPSNRSNGDVARIENGSAAKQYVIKHDPNGNTHVSDLTVVDVCSKREVSYLLKHASHSRLVGKTQMNEESSRSHFVFTMRISGISESTGQQIHGVLNLIDLAGSERLSKSGSTGDRLKETQSINKSLSSLCDVIFALAKKEEYVPYRNSKLTYLLQPCLGGDSKTLMFVNISPDSSSSGESLCSLRFAARVNACEIGVPRRNMSTRSSESRLSSG
ncbi:hypothetical protein SAY87_022107 [Trapa incisa]|uniref:Kinesin-like protein n=1 Tax=Trapa incisa TaxID=236973 RepID=A0AAN7JSS5_9MYRT|nr:hypothetical protein SAY87_022107 [Trapa incisa]